MKNTIFAIFLIGVLSACAQPVHHYNRISFRLSDEMESYYSLCQLDYKNINLDSLSCDAAEKIPVIDKNAPIFHEFEYTKYEPVSLVLYSNNEKMILLFKNDLFAIDSRCNLGTIPFSKGIFYIGGEVVLAIKNKLPINLEDSRLLSLDSLHYYKEIKDQKTGALTHMIIYSKDGLIKKTLRFFENHKTASEYYCFDHIDIDPETSPMHERRNELMFGREYYEDFKYGIPKYYISTTEEINIDSLGYITSRIIYDKVLGTGGIFKKYQQHHQISKHYTEIQSSLPQSIFHTSPINHHLYDDFICSPVIFRSPYAVQFSHVGYFPQDTLNLNKLQAFQNDIDIKVSFESGADIIGEPIIVKTKNGAETVYDIYLIETKASSDFEWTRAVIIPLEIGADEIFTINFPLEAPTDLLPSIDYDFAPRWILLGLNADKVIAEAPIVIYGKSDQWTEID